MTQRKPFNTEAEIPPIATDVQETLAASLLTPKKYDVVIVGAGLGGLTAAVEASLAGKTVLVIESRQETYAAIRPQLIYLQDSIIDYLNALNKRSKNKIAAQDLLMFANSSMIEHVGIKDIQRFLKRKSDNELCSFRYESKVMKIDLDKGSLLVVNVVDQLQQESVEFDDLILADGARHQTADLLFPHIQYKPIVDRPEKKHIMAYFTVEAKDKRLDGLTYPRALTVLSHDNYCGFLYFENAINGKKFKVCVVMHVSDLQFEKYKLNQESGVNFLKHCVASAYAPESWSIHMTTSKKYGHEKDKLKYAAFSLDFIEANQSAFEFNGKKIILVGDTKRSPDFYLGHGGNDAIIDGMLAGQVIKGEISIRSYNKKCLIRSKKTAKDTKNFQPIIDHYLRVNSNGRYSVSHYNDNIENKEGEALVSPHQVGLFASGRKRSGANASDEFHQDKKEKIRKSRR